MNSKAFKRELYIVRHGQSGRFRSIKWLILLLIGYSLYRWNGWSAIGWFILLGAILGILIHFVFRAKTHAWTQAWGAYKKVIKTPFD